MRFERKVGGVWVPVGPIGVGDFLSGKEFFRQQMSSTPTAVTSTTAVVFSPALEQAVIIPPVPFYLEGIFPFVRNSTGGQFVKIGIYSGAGANIYASKKMISATNNEADEIIVRTSPLTAADLGVSVGASVTFDCRWFVSANSGSLIVAGVGQPTFRGVYI